MTQSPARAFLGSSAPFIFSFSPGLSIISFKHRGPLTLFLKAKPKLRGACLNTSCVMAPILEAFTAYWSSQMGPLEPAQSFWGCQATVAEVAISGGDAQHKAFAVPACVRIGAPAIGCKQKASAACSPFSSPQPLHLFPPLPPFFYATIFL